MRLAARYLGLADRRRCFDIDNDRVLDIDQIIIPNNSPLCAILLYTS